MKITNEEMLEQVVKPILGCCREWISVEDRLPIKSGRYIVYSDIEGVNVSDYQVERDIWWHIEAIKPGVWRRYVPTHWMPLPDPPQKECDNARVD